MTHRILTLTAVVAALAVGGAGGATAASLITGKQVKNRSLTGKDIKKASLGPAVLTSAAKATLQGAPGAPGTDGADGAPGATGPAGPSDVFTHHRAEAIVSQSTTVATQALPSGLYAVSASFVLGETHGGKHQTCSLLTGKDTVLASEAIAMGADDRVSLTVAGAGQVTDSVRLSCALDDNAGRVTNIAIVSTRTGNAQVTVES